MSRQVRILRLERGICCHDVMPVTASGKSAPCTTLALSLSQRKIPSLDGLRAVRLKLYDEARGTLVTFAQARTMPRIEVVSA